MGMSSSQIDATTGWRTAHLLLAALISFLLILTTTALLLLRYSAMQPSVRQVAKPIATIAELADADTLQQTLQALERQGVTRQASPPPSGALLPVPYLEALAAHLRQQTGRQVQIEHTAEGGTRLWLSSARGDWIGVSPDPLRSVIARFALWVVVLAVLMAIAAAWWLASRLAGPIERLANVAARLPEPVAVEEFRVRGPREVRVLGARLAEALSRIDSQRRERDLLLAGLSHDLRTPLMRLLLRIDLIEAIPEDERVAIGADIAELDRRIDRFIEHARTGAEEPVSEVDLTRMLQSAIHASQLRGYHWQIDLPAAAPVRGQPGVLARLLDNLIDNAEQHGSAPFALTLSRAAELDTRWLLHVANARAAPIADRVTVPHRGFGLALCKNIATAHGGDLRADQDDDQFHVRLRLPAAEGTDRRR